MLCLCYDEQDAGLIAERNQSEYEKNKAKARKANIQFPTPFPTGLMKQSLVCEYKYKKVYKVYKIYKVYKV